MAWHVNLPQGQCPSTPTHKIYANFAISVRFKIYGPIPFEKLSVELTAGVI
jgi:hypothetical protein